MLVVTWASGGNVPPLLAAGPLMAARGHEVLVLASAASRPAAERAGFEVLSYKRSPDPDTRLAFERQAEAITATSAGPDIACDVRDVLAEVHLAIVGCLLPAALAAGTATSTPTASLVPFLYGLASRQMLHHGGGSTTDLEALDATHRALGLAPPSDGLTAWETAELVLVTAPRWLDVELDYSPNMIHAGPLGTRTRPRTPSRRDDRQRRRVLLSFSTTVMEGQLQALQRVCDGIARTAVQAILTLGPAVDKAALRTPDNVDVLPWADHERLLPTCAAVITHGGLGMTLRALAHGVLLLFLPLGRDHAFNDARAVEHGAGIRLAPNAGPIDVGTALAWLLNEPGFRAAADSAATCLAAGAPDRHAADALDRCARRHQGDESAA